MDISTVLKDFSKNYKNGKVVNKSRFQCNTEQLKSLCISLTAIKRGITFEQAEQLNLFHTTMCSGDNVPNIPFHQQYGYDENMNQNFKEISLSFKYIARSGNITITLQDDIVNLINQIIK